MIEIPEAIVLSRQISEYLKGKKITDVIANQSPHKFAWYNGAPETYPERLVGKTAQSAQARGGFVEMHLDGQFILFSEGVKLRYLMKGQKLPKKHQLLIAFNDDSTMAASVQMYGGLYAGDETFDNEYYLGAKRKPSPLSETFDYDYFIKLITTEALLGKSVKAAIATEQRIPGFGNGVLQDVLYNSRIHPKRKMESLTEAELTDLFKALKTTLNEMIAGGGRDTETDLFGEPGGYSTKMSKFTVDKPCSVCGEKVVKKAYMGGSIYYCPGCQQEKV